MIVIDRLPFFYKSHAEKGNLEFPEVFRFDLFFDNGLKMFRQKGSEELKLLLNKVYLDGSLVEGSLSSESGLVYLDKVFEYLVEKSKLNLESDILEIGFGSGALIKKLKDSGFRNIIGVEPGNHQMVSGIEDVTLIRDFFPSPRITQKFDLIFSFGILEHISNPTDFLINQALHLKKDGSIIVSVPNCEPYLLNGDPSIFIHEHYNYFTKEALIKIAHHANLCIHDLTIIEGAFIATMKKKESIYKCDYIVFKEEHFFKKLSNYMSTMARFFDDYNENDVAVYTPIRAMNTLYLLGYRNVRLLDDNSELHNRFLPFFNNIIESFSDIVSNPPKAILIMSRTFGHRLKEKCSNEILLKGVFIVTIEDLDSLQIK